MTTIAYKDGIMAADTNVNSGGVAAYHIKKIIKTDKYLIGTSGALFKCDALVQHIIDGTKPDKELEGCEAIVVTKTGEIYNVGGCGTWITVDSAFITSGSGEVVALGAMHAGASAARAVEIACQLDNSTGGNVITEKF